MVVIPTPGGTETGQFRHGAAETGGAGSVKPAGSPRRSGRRSPWRRVWCIIRPDPCWHIATRRLTLRLPFETHPDLPSDDADRRRIAIWLIACAGVIFAMIVLGGVTRLTGSGLSMVEWKPLMGVLPPLNEAHWQATFEKYQAFPEYQKVNRHLDLAGFKTIFYFEYAHRLLGRLIGVIFLLPFLCFYFRRRIPEGLTPKLVVMFVLGGLQGLLGWYMVKSGLVDEPRVSQYRLAAHLGLAVAIYGYILWVAFGLLLHRARFPAPAGRGDYRLALGVAVLVFVMILSGGLVAGTRAGLIYNTFPLMGGELIPPGLFALEPWWLNAFENLVAIQFNHRMLACLVVVLVTAFCVMLLRRRPDRHTAIAAVVLLSVLAVQVAIGIATLLLHVPVALAATHQGVAVVVFTASLYLARRLGGTRAASRT